jgi:NAD(P)H dehydrogenase (quinone)
MRIMVLFAHPLEDSFNAALHRTVVTALRESGHEVDDCDLYAEGFDPVLNAEERRYYHDETGNRAPVACYVERLLAADAMVLCYPTWSFGPPAILKGFLDRVLMPGVSFTLENGRARPALTHIRHLAAG